MAQVSPVNLHQSEAIPWKIKRTTTIYKLKNMRKKNRFLFLSYKV